jgi:hypothetical protein
LNLEISYLDYQVQVFFEWKDKVKYKVIRKGRRAGITKGAANFCIETLLSKQGPILWGETTHGNIQRYFDRYFLPVLKENKIEYRFDKQSKQFNIGNQFCDFRSADNPENWEGFGYKFIFLNEAGIILKDKSLYVNSVLPMLIDFPDSKLIAAGVPKGKFLKDGQQHPFYTLAKRAEEGNEKYEMLCFSSYSNPLLSTTDIEELELEIAAFSPEQVQQEIYGEFIETDAINPFAYAYDSKKHEATEKEVKEGTAIFNPSRQIIISVDFNLNPFAVTFRHFWSDQWGEHWHVFDEAEIKNGSIPAMVDLIKTKYGRWLHAARLTGDAMGSRGDISQRDNASLYKQLIRGLGMKDSQLVVKGNPLHENSRSDVNYVLTHFVDYKINSVKCPNLCRDMKNVQCDAFGGIIKKNRNDMNQKADYCDAERYAIHSFLRSWINQHQKISVRK